MKHDDGTGMDRRVSDGQCNVSMAIILTRWDIEECSDVRFYSRDGEGQGTMPKQASTPLPVNESKQTRGEKAEGERRVIGSMHYGHPPFSIWASFFSRRTEV